LSSTTLYRLSGVAIILGALLAIIGNVLSSILFPGNDPHQYVSALWLPVMLLSFIGSLLLVVGLPGMVARQATRAGWLGLVGFALIIIGGILFTSLNATTFLVLPWLAVNAPKLAAGNGPPAIFVYVLVASLLFAVGGVLLGIATMRAGVLPRWAGLLIIVGAVLNLVAFPLSGAIGSIVGTLAFVLFALGFAWVGYALVSGGGSEIAQPSPVPSQAGS
jgi:hypothetical protein